MEAQRDESFKVARRPKPPNSNRIFNIPGLVLAIALITAGVFALLVFYRPSVLPILNSFGGLRPGFMLDRLAQGAPLWPTIAPVFGHILVHANFPHLFINMAFLLALGSPTVRHMNAEYALQSAKRIYNAGVFLLFYVACGAAGALLFVALNANVLTTMVGASSAISGLLGAVVRFGMNRSAMVVGVQDARFSPLHSPSVIVWTVLIVGSNLATGIIGPALTDTATHIAWEAHIGGYLFGLLGYPVFYALTMQDTD